MFQFIINKHEPQNLKKHNKREHGENATKLGDINSRFPGLVALDYMLRSQNGAAKLPGNYSRLQHHQKK